MLKPFLKKIKTGITKGHELKPRKFILLSAALLGIFFVAAFSSIFAIELIFEKIFHITSDNAVMYFINDPNGRLKVVNDLRFDQADSLIFELDFSPVFTLVEEIEAVVDNDPRMELTWDEKEGSGVIKEFRPDGSKFLVILSRFAGNVGIPKGFNVKGVFIGGDPRYGAGSTYDERNRNSTGIAYYDGNRWLHVWCNANEALGIGSLREGKEKRYSIQAEPWGWTFLDSRALHENSSEVILQSRHNLKAITADMTPVDLTMKRTLYKRAGDDYVVLKVEYINTGKYPLAFSYAYGDEPWLGDFGSSSGDVGWTDKTLFNYQGTVSTLRHSYAGFWDIGNEVAGEGHAFTGLANFIDWKLNPPDLVYFVNDPISNPYHIEPRAPLDSENSRFINLLWADETLTPGANKIYFLVIGMAGKTSAGNFPQRPLITLEGKVW